MTSTIQSSVHGETASDPNHDSGSTQITVEVGPMAHGGHCVARHEGRVVFVRHAIPGEIVVAQLTEHGPKSRFWRADTVEVVRPSEFRRSHQWKLADSLRAYNAGRQPVGGAEYGHIILEHQRRLKAHVFRDTMARIGKVSVEPHVYGIEGDEPTGLNWRTRNSFAVNEAGRLSMHVHRSMTTIPVRNIPLAVPELDELHLWDVNFTGVARVEVASPAHGAESLIVLYPVPRVAASEETLQSHIGKWRKQLNKLPESVSVVVGIQQKKHSPLELIRLRGRTWAQEIVKTESHGSRTYRVTGDGFWQVHREAPATLVDAVMKAADPQPGEIIADLYGGAGLFSGFLAQAVGDTGTVLSVEAAPGASRDARRNLHDLEQAIVLNGKTEQVVASWLQTPEAPVTRGGLEGRQLDTIVLDPPRAGAGRSAIHRIHQLKPQKIVYVSCDPASFARDTRWLTEQGWELRTVDVYDLYPDTHHMESVGVFTSP